MVMAGLSLITRVSGLDSSVERLLSESLYVR
jgi:hypothetical protein